MKRKQQVRIKFRESVFKRDGHKCRFCEETEELDAHHITDRNEMPNGGYVKENGITLCAIHHAEAEIWHQSGKKTWKEGMHPDDLYAMIESSYEKAFDASEELG
jgi:hypothetical protein